MDGLTAVYGKEITELEIALECLRCSHIQLSLCLFLVS